MSAVFDVTIDNIYCALIYATHQEAKGRKATFD